MVLLLLCLSVLESLFAKQWPKYESSLAKSTLRSASKHKTISQSYRSSVEVATIAKVQCVLQPDVDYSPTDITPGVTYVMPGPCGIVKSPVTGLLPSVRDVSMRWDLTSPPDTYLNLTFVEFSLLYSIDECKRDWVQILIFYHGTELTFWKKCDHLLPWTAIIIFKRIHLEFGVWRLGDSKFNLLYQVVDKHTIQSSNDRQVIMEPGLTTSISHPKRIMKSDFSQWRSIAYFRTIFTHQIQVNFTVISYNGSVLSGHDWLVLSASDGPTVSSPPLAITLLQGDDRSEHVVNMSAGFHLTVSMRVAESHSQHVDSSIDPIIINYTSIPSYFESNTTMLTNNLEMDLQVSSEDPWCQHANGLVMCTYNVTVADWNPASPTFVHITITDMTFVVPNTRECDCGGVQMMTNFIYTGKGIKHGFPWLYAPAVLCHGLHKDKPAVKLTLPFNTYTSRSRSLLVALYIYPITPGAVPLTKAQFHLSTSSCQGLDVLCQGEIPPKAYKGQIDSPDIYAGKR